MIRYVCSECGNEALMEDRSDQKFCSKCGEPTARPATWPPSKQRSRLVNVISGEVANIDARSFASAASNDEDPVPDMDARVRQYGGLIKAWMGKDGLQYLRDLDQSEMDAVLDALLEKAPAQAFIFWQFRPWFYRFAGRARDALLKIA